MTYLVSRKDQNVIIKRPYVDRRLLSLEYGYLPRYLLVYLPQIALPQLSVPLMPITSRVSS